MFAMQCWDSESWAARLICDPFWFWNILDSIEYREKSCRHEKIDCWSERRMQIRRVLRRFMTVRCVVVLFIIVGFATIIRYTLQKKFSSIPIVDSVSSKFYLADPIDLLDAKISLDNKRFQSYPEDYFDRTNLTCQYPRLTIDNAEVWKYLQPVKQSKPECEKSENWVYVENGL